MTDQGETYRSVWRHMMTVPFRQDYIDLGGVRTRFVHAGKPDAPVVIMLHGFAGHWETFCANIGPISEHFNVYALDFIGSGLTDKPEGAYEVPDYMKQVLDFMDAMKIEKASFIGVSLGSWVSAQLAVSHPERVEKLVIVSASGFFNPTVVAAVKNFNEAVNTRRVSGNDPSWERIRATLRDLVFDESSVLDDIIAVRQHMYQQPGAHAAMQKMLGIFTPDVAVRNAIAEDKWRDMKTPILLIANVDEEDLFLATARELAKLLPNSRTVDIKRAAHWAHFEDPETFNRAALDFLSGVESS